MADFNEDIIVEGTHNYSMESEYVEPFPLIKSHLVFFMILPEKINITKLFQENRWGTFISYIRQHLTISTR